MKGSAARSNPDFQYIISKIDSILQFNNVLKVGFPRIDDVCARDSQQAHLAIRPRT